MDRLIPPMKKVLALIGALGVAACTYHTSVSFAPGFAVEGPFLPRPDQRIEGRYILVIDRGVETLSREIRGGGLACSAYSFHVDIGSITRDSVSQTLGQVFEDIQTGPAPLTREEMREQDYDGVVTVRVDRFAPWLGFANGTAALTNLDLSLTVDGPVGPLFATSVSSARRGVARGGGSCQGAAEALARSVESAIRDALSRLVDQLVGSKELGQASKRI